MTARSRSRRSSTRRAGRPPGICGRRPRPLRSPASSRSPRSPCRKRSDREVHVPVVPQLRPPRRVARLPGADACRRAGRNQRRGGRDGPAVHARDRREFWRGRASPPAVRRLRRRALRPRVDRARRRRSGERNHPQATEAQRAPRRARSAERARGGSAPDLGGGRRPHGGAVLLLRARRRAGPPARRRPATRTARCAIGSIRFPPTCASRCSTRARPAPSRG